MRRSVSRVILGALIAAGCGTADDGGKGGTGGTGGTGGMPPRPGGGGSGGGTGGPAAGTNPYKCAAFATPVEVEEKIVLPKCGKDSNCHSGPTWKPLIKEVGKIVPKLFDEMPFPFCPKDRFLIKGDPEKSLMMRVLNPPAVRARCGDGTEGPLKMPPTLPPTWTEPPLAPADLECMKWWIYEVSRP